MALQRNGLARRALGARRDIARCAARVIDIRADRRAMIAGGTRQAAEVGGQTLLDADERVADGAQLLLDAGAAAAVAPTALGTPRLDARRATLAGATVPDHLHVLGIRECLAEVAIEVGTV